MATFLVIVVLSFGLHLVSSTDCDYPFECESQTITDNANCFGYGSCHSTSIQTDHSVHCDGAHSCHSALIDTSDSTLCRSVASCKSATLQSSKIYCEGVESCSDSYINSADIVYSYGHYGAVNAFISGVPTVRGYGYYALLYSTIDSGDSNTMYVKMFGVDAGYAANILCQSGAECTLSCKSGGCLELDFLCFEGSACSVSPEQCLSDDSVDEYDGISCPKWRISSSEEEDHVFMEYMEQKEMEKEDNIKYQLFQMYMLDDTESFAEKIKNKNNVVYDYDNISLLNNTYKTNSYYYLFGAIVSFVIVAIYFCGSKLCSSEYQKM